MQSLFFFLVAIAILVVIHEFGHFWVARKCGVKVLRFSVGFGKPLWSRTGADGTEYVLASIPLGGYVKMLDEREAPVAEHEQDAAFNRQPLFSRSAIVAAGPLANLLFAVFAYWMVFVIGIPGIKPIIGQLEANSVAEQSGLLAGDQITAINDSKVFTWSDTYRSLMNHSQTGDTVRVSVLGEDKSQQAVQLNLPQLSLEDSAKVLSHIGLMPYQPNIEPIIGKVVEGSPADKAGLQAGDRLLAYAGQQIDNWQDWVTLIQQHPEQDLLINIQRSGKTIAVNLTPEKDAQGVGKAGVAVDPSATEIPAELKTKQQYGPIDAIWQAVKQTWLLSSTTVSSIGGMLSGSVSTDNIGGPIAIAQIAGSSAHQGLLSFINFLAMVSISLGILNLLPIPVLDGGHLAMYLIEAVRGKPLSENAQLMGQKLGFLLLIMLMLLAFSNDLLRLFG
jgi:regulator of sigma E protease